MARKTHNHRLDVPPLELECLKALWTMGAATVHQVRASLAPARPLAYTTVMTLMDRLARKGMAEREKRGRSYLYRPVLDPRPVCEFALDRLTRNFFRGSRQALRLYLEGAEPASFVSSASSAPLASEPSAPERPAPVEESLDPSLL